MGAAVRFVAALALVGLAAATGITAYGVLQNLWADYQDGATSTYLVIGLPIAAAALGFLIAAVALLRWPRAK